ncbi:hypothetical protein B484DRAFT_451204 [Ochromonadaceae sp. CCMP2298]|nr:hypothetical protein B484DRAFT_451204 [Ochromonadaceae sp. CCMP2298]|mmetsp:Transcript_27599/g.61121  ORF Transcript_27599/g.61121 Transcript_27599/m.61121 type:complete len:204 (+) Transcript_27599:648-1259(+)
MHVAADNVTDGFGNIKSVQRAGSFGLQPHEIHLGLFYSSISACLIAAAYQGVSRPLLSYSVALVWCSFVLAISLMEAWVKFKAPSITKAVALDVGKKVFRCLNIVEVIFAATLHILQPFLLSSFFATSILLYQIWVLSPELVERADAIIWEAQMQGQGGRGMGQGQGQGQSLFLFRPHVLYVFLEGLKVCCLLCSAAAAASQL